MNNKNCLKDGFNEMYMYTYYWLLRSIVKGLQATSPIPNGQPIIEVIGKVMTKQQYDKDNFGQRE